MKKKLIVLTITLSVIIAGTIGFLYINNNAVDVKYNNSPDLSKKVVESKNLMLLRQPIDSFDSLINSVNDEIYVVVGKVISGPEIKSDTMGTDKSMDENGNMRYFESPSYYYKVEVEELVQGSMETKVFTLLQGFGTKVEVGKKYLMVLIKDKLSNIRSISDKDNIYGSIDLERGFFELNENIKSGTTIKETISMADDLCLAKYDGLDVEILKNDLKKAINDKKSKAKK